MKNVYIQEDSYAYEAESN